MNSASKTPKSSANILRWKIILIFGTIVAGNLVYLLWKWFENGGFTTADFVGAVIGLVISLSLIFLVIRRFKSKQSPLPPPIP